MNCRVCVYAYPNCMYAYRVVCAYIENEVICMHCLASQKSLDLVMLLLLEWTPADSLCCCGRDC